jgi:hypothetical protein
MAAEGALTAGGGIPDADEVVVPVGGGEFAVGREGDGDGVRPVTEAGRAHAGDARR